MIGAFVGAFLISVIMTSFLLTTGEPAFLWIEDPMAWLTLVVAAAVGFAIQKWAIAPNFREDDSESSA